MSKKLLIFIVSTFLLSGGVVLAEHKSESEKEELRAVKMQQAKLHAKERLLRLKHALKLNDSQTAAWSDYKKHVEESVT